MDRYYYLIASLPALSKTEKPIIGSAALLEQARQWLTKYDQRVLDGASIHDPFVGSEHCPVLEQWAVFETNLRNVMVTVRSRLRSVEPKHYYHPVDEVVSGLETQVVECLGLPTPLEIERALLDLRWRFLESLEPGHHFDIDCLVIYYLKIQLLERLFSFEPAVGRQVLATIGTAAQ